VRPEQGTYRGPASAISAFGLANSMDGDGSNALSEDRREATRDAAFETTDARFNRIMHEYGAALSRLAFGYEKVAGAREELTQDIALAIWQALPHFRGESSERTFIYRIAHNRGLSHVFKRHPAHDALPLPLDDLPRPLEPVDPRPQPEEQLAIANQRDRLRTAIQRLPLAYRQVVMLLLEELSHAEIAEVLGISESNVAVRLNRARKALKEALEARS
jgi:RNA polymerase sigma factor (sigma-70 family)